VPNLLELDRWETIQAEKGRTLNVYSTRQDTEAKAAFMFASPGAEYGRRDTARQQEILTEVFASHGWIAPQLLDAMPAAPDFYFDGLSVVEMESWSAGRVALVGDAAYCPSPASSDPASPPASVDDVAHTTDGEREDGASQRSRPRSVHDSAGQKRRDLGLLRLEPSVHRAHACVPRRLREEASVASFVLVVHAEAGGHRREVGVVSLEP